MLAIQKVLNSTEQPIPLIFSVTSSLVVHEHTCPEAGEEELVLMTKIMDKMTTDLDLSIFHDGYKERIEAMIKSIIQAMYGY